MSSKPKSAKAIVISGEAIDLNSLPVAPEFVDVLAENATKAALEHLRKIEARPELIQLVESISDLGYYLKLCYSDPASLLGEREHRFDIETIVIEAVNAIAGIGGAFHGPYGDTLSRDETLPANSRRASAKKSN